jgi:tetratricopeptide (TPR) repeat protein
MLYEMVTGRPPFLGDDSVAIIGQHINTPPVAPTWHNGNCPRPLEALIMRLLAKDPSQRPESATDVLSALDAVDLATSIEQPAVSDDEAHSLDSLAGGVFVGRQREMGELKASLEDALSGRGRLVTLVGEPGIGKTRTALELATYAGLRQAHVLWGRCYEGEGAPPYWPWVQAIRSYVRDVDPEQLRSEMGAGAADIAEVVSDVREQLPGLESPSRLEPEQARFRLFDSITAFLKSAGRRKPLVLVLDDLHWADHPSLLLLEFVARELANARVMIIGTYRDMELSRQHPLSKTLGELNRERLFQRVLLHGLDQEDVGRFIELASGVTPPAGMLDAVHGQTEGNPLFVTEVVRLLVQEGELTQESEARDSWAVRIPEGVREVIGRRLNRLSQQCNETLTIASVIGREFELKHLARLVENLSEDRLLEVLEEALSARVIEELPQAVGRYQFTHALIQNTLTEELTLTRRVRLHARIAETLEELYGDDAEAHAAELAHHYAEAEGVLGTEKLVRYALLAGERTMSTYAYEEALAHFERGLTAKEGEAPDSARSIDAETAALLHGLGRTQLITLQVDEGWANLTRAFDYYAEVGDIPRIADIAAQPVSLAAPGQIAPLLTRALEMVPPDSHEAGRLLPWYGRLLSAVQGDFDGAQEALSRALAIAQREGDVALQMQALAFSADVEGFNFHWQQSLEKALQAIELTRLVDNPLAEAIANMWAGLALGAMGGDEERLRQYYTASLAAAERLRDRVWLPLMLAYASRAHSAWGDWQTARKLSDRGLALAPSHPILISGRIMLEYQVGDFEQGGAHLDRLVDAVRLAASGSWLAVSQEPATGSTLPKRPRKPPSRLLLFDLGLRTRLGSVSPS